MLPRQTDQALEFGPSRRQSMKPGAEEGHVSDVAYLHGHDVPGPSWRAAYSFGLVLITAALSSRCQRGKIPACHKTE